MTKRIYDRGKAVPGDNIAGVPGARSTRDGCGIGTEWVRRAGEGGGVRVRDERCRGCDDERCDDKRCAMRGCSADFLLSSWRRARGNGRFSPKTQLSAFYGLKPPFFARFSMFFRSRSRRWSRSAVFARSHRVTRAAPHLSARISLAVITPSLVCQTQNKIISKRFTRFASFFCSVSASACLYNALREGFNCRINSKNCCFT